VVSDEVYGCTEAASYLINQGLQDLWVLDPWPTPGASPRRRVAAIMDAAEKMGIRPPRILRIPNTDDPIMIARNAYESVRAGIASYGLPEGIFTLSDMRAYGVFRAVAEAGARIGVDVAIVGHDDIVFSEMLRPSLTTVAQPMLEMGAKAAECL